jgi:hypothetical protein
MGRTAPGTTGRHVDLARRLHQPGARAVPEHRPSASDMLALGSFGRGTTRPKLLPRGERRKGRSSRRAVRWSDRSRPRGFSVLTPNDAKRDLVRCEIDVDAHRAFRIAAAITLAPDRKGRAAVRAASAIRHRQGLTAFRCDPAAYPPGPLSWRYWHNGLPRPL